MRPELEVRGLAKTYGSGDSAVEAIKSLTFDVASGEFVCVVGPSGCGKTTLMRCISGLLNPSGGAAYLAGERIDQPPEDLALVFQDYSRSLLPWLTIGHNVTLPLRSKGVPKAERDRNARSSLQAVGLDGVADLYPWQLSGGMQQRAAIARALAYEPSVLLMDEPFASVDAQTRADLEDLVLEVHRESELTVLFVTHDIDEAVYLSDRIIVLGDRPTEVVETVDVSMPRPRDQIATRELEEFTRLRNHIFRRIKRRSSSLQEDIRTD